MDHPMTTIDYAKARETMVEQQVRPWEVFDSRVLDTLTTLPRDRFVADAHRALAYSDIELPLGHGETMLKPVIEGRALQALSVGESEDVLEIGTGSGFLSACLGRLAREVVSIERHADLADAARARLQTQGIANVRIETADVFGWQSTRKFDAILVGGAVANVPEAFSNWLRPGGRMFVVHGEAPAMDAALIHLEADGRLRIESLFETVVPYLVGAAPAPTFQL
jgi:protein-L-isoaspartate(D-aspartate) O-methyltransferase